MNQSKYSAFTLVELIVVVAVLAVLATIAFSAVSNVTFSARNSARLTDVTTIVSKLEMQLSFGKVFPKPDDAVNLIASGAVVGYQGNFGALSARTAELSEILDPLDKKYYTYTVDSTLKSYQLLGFKESTTSFAPTQTVYANSARILFTKGKLLGILLDSTSNTAIEKTYPNSQLDIVNTNSGLTAVFSNTKQISGTGVAFGGPMWNLLAKSANFDAPKTCPTGFIPVPGNMEFLQPGFCVAKYEMKQTVGDQGRYTYAGSPMGDAITPYCTNSVQCNATSGTWAKGNITSKAEGYSIVWINQYSASEACKSMGEGYHLITNNEYMAIARNAEQVASNWASWAVGSGYMYSGHNDGIPNNMLTATMDDIQGYFGTDNSGSTSNQRRTLALSNGQTIWDLAGNAWEHVNKANTLNSSNHSSNSIWNANACGGGGWFSFYGNDWVAQCSYQNNYTYNNIWPFIPNLNNTNSVGRIYSSSATNNVFLRWGGWYGTASTGAFTLYLNWNTTALDDGLLQGCRVGFRCAK